MKALLLLCFIACAFAQSNGIPQLVNRGSEKFLSVDGKPYLMLAAELHNSSSSNLDYMKPIWPKLAAIPLNTVLTPLSWELIEPKPGQFDFTLVDGLVEGARANHLHLVFLWLASWKNGMSSYAPLWIKADTKRFPRVIESDHGEVEILSTLGRDTMEADARAFAALMRHLKEIDGQKHTVLMMQVENEVGVLGDTRDHSPAANQAFDSEVPPELTAYLKDHREDLFPDLRDLWNSNGSRTSGTWQNVFGSAYRADEIFMAWNYSRYVNHVAAAGKAEYPLPMYVNTWLAGPTTPPGDYPSGGPQPRVIDIWKAAGSAIDIYSPDIYRPNFAEWCNWYHRAGNPLFIPEAIGGSVAEQNAFYAFGNGAIGFSPFAIDSESNPKDDLGRSYRALEQLAPLISSHEPGKLMTGFLLDETEPTILADLAGYELNISLDDIFGSRAKKAYGIIIVTGPNEFIGAGSGFHVSFTPRAPGPPHAGIWYVEEGTFKEGTWSPGRRLNGDENDQGKYWRFGPESSEIEKVRLYRYGNEPH
jgi:beta-galactosidase GanA